MVKQRLNTFLNRSTLIKLLGVLLYFSLLFFLLPLEFKDVSVRVFLYLIIAGSAAFLAYILIPENSWFRGPGLLAGLAAFLLFGSLALVRLTGFCVQRDRGEVFVNRTDKSVKIIAKGYGCLMTDEDIEYYKERTLSENFKWVTKFNEKPVDTTKWRPLRK